MAPARKTKDWLNSPAAEDAADVSAAVSTIDPGSTSPSEPESEQASATSTQPDWSAELPRAKEGASTALQELDSWHQRVGKVTGQLAAVRAEQQVALEDHDADSEKRVERIANAQIREKVIAADLEHERAPRTKLINTDASQTRNERRLSTALPTTVRHPARDLNRTDVPMLSQIRSMFCIVGRVAPG